MMTNDLDPGTVQGICEGILDDDVFTDAPEKAEAVAWLKDQAREVLRSLGLKADLDDTFCPVCRMNVGPDHNDDACRAEYDGEEYAEADRKRAEDALSVEGAFARGDFVTAVSCQAAAMVNEPPHFRTLADAFRVIADDLLKASVAVEGYEAVWGTEREA